MILKFQTKNILLCSYRFYILLPLYNTHVIQSRGHLASELDPLGIITSEKTMGRDGLTRRANEDVLRQHSGFLFGNLFTFISFLNINQVSFFFCPKKKLKHNNFNILIYINEIRSVFSKTFVFFFLNYANHKNLNQINIQQAFLRNKKK